MVTLPAIVRAAPLFLVLALFLVTTPAVAWQEGDKLHLQFGAYTHFGGDDNEDYEGPPIVGNFELNKESNWLFGLTLFNNSFGQFSQYLYVGKKWQLPKLYEHLHVKLTGGLLHGYVDEYEDKVPFNNNGFSPGIVPSVGVKKGRWAFDMMALGGAGLLFAVGYDIVD